MRLPRLFGQLPVSAVQHCAHEEAARGSYRSHNARSLSPDEQSKVGSEENDTTASIIVTPPKPGQAY
jgi:hypothetical protein